MKAKKKVHMVGWNSRLVVSPLRGEGAFKPKKARNADELQARIDAVVKKAFSIQQSASGVDVIREFRPVQRRSLKAYRVG